MADSCLFSNRPVRATSSREILACLTNLGWQPHDQRKAQLPFDHFAQRFAADRLHQLQHALGRDPVASDLVLVDLDLQHALAGDLLGVDVGIAGYRANDGFDLVGRFHQLIEVVAKQLDAQVVMATIHRGER